MFEASNCSFTCILVSQIPLPNETMRFFDLAGVFFQFNVIYKRMHVHNKVNGLNVKSHMEHRDSFTILAYGSLDSLFPILMSPNCKLMSPDYYFS